RQLGAEGRVANHERGGCECGRRSERRDRSRQTAQPGHEKDGENDERRHQRGDKQRRAELLRQHAHGSARPAAGRPICRKAKNDGGAKASRRATSASTSATLSRPRAGAFFSCGLSPESAGASTRYRYPPASNPPAAMTSAHTHWPASTEAFINSHFAAN